MECHPIALRVHENGHKPILADRGFRHYDFAAGRFYPAERHTQIVAAVEINERSFGTRFVAVAMRDAATRTAIADRKKCHLEGPAHFLQIGAEYFAVEFDRPVKIGSRDFKPIDCTCHDLIFCKYSENALSLESKTLYFNTLYVKCLRESQPEKAETALRDLMKILENYPTRVKEDPVSYITTVNNLAGFYVFRNDGEKALSLLSRSRNFLENLGIPDGRKPVLKQIVRTTNIELEIYRNAADPYRHEPFFLEAEVFVKKLAPKMPAEYLLSFHFQFAWICFLRKEYDKVLEWLGGPLNEWRKHSGHYIFRHLLLLNLMVHCERRNLFVLRYFVESARRQFKKSGEAKPYELELLHFFSKIGQAPELEYRKLYLELKQKLFPIQGASLVPEEALRMMDFRRWLNE